MRDDADITKSHDKTAAIKTLATMLDYAIIEGAQLRLPVFVFMLRAARLELISSVQIPEKTSSVPDMRSQTSLN